MARIVELVAPSGCGKTTLYNALRQAWKRSSGWVCYHDISRPWARSSVAYRVRCASKALMGLPAPRPNHTYWVSDGYMRANPELSQRCWTLLRECEDRVGLRFTDLILDAFAVQSNIDSASDPRTIIVDEGIARRLIARWPEEPSQALERAVQAAPLPDLLISLEADPAVIASRLSGRASSGVTSDEILAMSQVGVAVTRRTLAAYERRGVPIERLDAAATPAAVQRDMFRLLADIS